MFLQLNPADAVESTPVSFPAGQTQLWPTVQPIKELADPRIFGTVFQDVRLFHPPLIDRAVRQAQEIPPNHRGAGGQKVRDAETWALAGMQLLTQRALCLFCKTQHVDSAHVLDRWINVLGTGDYSAPHSHYDAQSAVVYVLDPGDGPADAMDGSLEIIDVRIPFCCPDHPDRPHQGVSPVLRAGMMILFPAMFLHFVHPYTGRRPRITIAWNLNPGPPPSEGQDSTQQLPMRPGTYRAEDHLLG